MFHTQNRLYFERQANGSVRLLKKDEDENVLLDQTLDKNTWASVISSMSKGSEEDLRYFSALNFHESKGPIAIIPVVWAHADGVGNSGGGFWTAAPDVSYNPGKTWDQR